MSNIVVVIEHLVKSNYFQRLRHDKGFKITFNENK